jgi:site-specific recombinase
MTRIQTINTEPVIPVKKLLVIAGIGLYLSGMVTGWFAYDHNPVEMYVDKPAYLKAKR